MTRVAIVHDYLTQRGGAERVLVSMARAFPDAPVHTAVYDPGGTFPELADLDVRPMWTNRLRSLRADHRRGLALYPVAFGQLRVEADVVLCSSSGFAHGVQTDGRKVVYCYTPPRWLYDQADAYLRPLAASARTVAQAMAPTLRAWDRRAAATADAYLTTSTIVRQRIRDCYGIDAALVPPGMTVDPGGHREPVGGCAPRFVLCVSRLLGYKNVDRIVAAFAGLPDVPLVVAGDGPERERLVAGATANVTFVGGVSDAQLRWLYGRCSMLVAASFEDFGLTPLEAAAFGAPAAVLRSGGYLDTVVEDVTGRFFDGVGPHAIAATVASLLARPLPRQPILDHADWYSDHAFIARLTEAVAPQDRSRQLAGPAGT